MTYSTVLLTTKQRDRIAFIDLIRLEAQMFVHDVEQTSRVLKSHKNIRFSI